MEETKKDLKITAEDLSELKDEQHRFYARTVTKPGSALDKFDDALNQLTENEKWILFLHHAENQPFKVIATEMSLPYHDPQQVKNIHDESMQKLIEELDLSSEDEISHLFVFKDLQQKALKVINTLSS
ncbi:MAG: hypothetical protein WD335_00645 [Candidatus Paceibacterota bacterium]